MSSHGFSFKAASISLALLGILSMAAQGADETVVAPPPPGSQWSVAVDYGADGAGEESETDGESESENDAAGVEPSSSDDEEDELPRIPTKVEMKKDRNGLCEGRISFADGSESVFYVVSGRVFMRSDNSDDVFSFATRPLDATMLQTDGWVGAGWVEPELMAGVVERDGIETTRYFFDGAKAQPENPLPNLEAWIGLESKYPMEIHVGDFVCRFTAPAPYTELVELPSDFREAYEGARETQRKMDMIRKSNAARDR